MSPASTGVPTVKSPIGFGRLARLPPAPPAGPAPAAPAVPAPAVPRRCPRPPCRAACRSPPRRVGPEPAPPSCALLPLVEQPTATASAPIARLQLNAYRMRIETIPPPMFGRRSEDQGVTEDGPRRVSRPGAVGDLVRVGPRRGVARRIHGAAWPGRPAAIGGGRKRGGSASRQRSLPPAQSTETNQRGKVVPDAPPTPSPSAT